MKKLVAILLILCMAMSAVACTQNPQTEENAAPAAQPTSATQGDSTETVENAEDIPHGGTLIVAETMDPTCFLSVATSDRSAHLFSAPLYPMLLDYDVYNDMEPVCSELATSYDFVDNKVLTFHLREDAVWSDGTPITAHDVVFTINEFVIPYSPFGGQFLKNMESCVAADDYTVVITMSVEFPNLIYFWHRHYCQIYPKHIWENYVENFTECPEYSNPTTTGGAWVMEEYVPGEYISYLPYENYFKVGQPYLDKLIIRIIPDSDTQVAALEAGEIDVTIPQVFPVNQGARFADSDEFTLTEYGFDYGAVIYYLFLNHEDPYLSDINVRRAVAHAINRDQVVSDLLAGYGLPLDTILPKGAMWDKYSTTPETIYEYNVDKANQLLDEAGYPRDASGSRGITLSYACMNNTTIIKYGEMIKSYLSEIGIDLEITTLETASFIDQNCINGQFSMSCVDMIASVDFSVEGRVYRSDRIGVAFGNMFRVNNPRVDEIFAEMASASGQEQIDLYVELQNILADDCVGVFIQSKPCHVFRSSFKNLPATPHAQKEDYDDVYYVG